MKLDYVHALFGMGGYPPMRIHAMFRGDKVEAWRGDCPATGVPVSWRFFDRERFDSFCRMLEAWKASGFKRQVPGFRLSKDTSKALFQQGDNRE